MKTDSKTLTISPEAEKDIAELKYKINAFQTGKMDEERFKHYRLTRGVYGQRQLGVQMFRIKIPYGKITTEQLVRIADVSERFTPGNLHLTTRQDIQYHHVKLNDSPTIWELLAEKNVTAREACGNTVRNITASPIAGIDPNEPFDVTPYAHAAFEYFLRNPICQEMGRKIKIAFSSSEADSAFAYFHDFGMIPKVKIENGVEKRGFKVLVAGGLGAQAMEAHEAFDFLEEEKLLPFMEAAIRVFDRYGEREKRFKARMKFLLKKLGLAAWLDLVNEELQGLTQQTIPIKTDDFEPTELPKNNFHSLNWSHDTSYNLWKETNVFEQKQSGYFGVYVKVQLGDIHAEKARQFAEIIKKYAADDIRVTVNQGFLLRYVEADGLPYLYTALNSIGLAEAGFDSIADVTACPGTDTCNLAVTNSTGLSQHIEQLIWAEFPHLIHDQFLKIKISGCMNACGQHTAAQIGFHGSSIKKKALIIPAMQILLGGGLNPDGTGKIADKIIKLPTKKILEALRSLLTDFENNKTENEIFNNYYRRQGKKYFHQLLKPLADTSELQKEDFFDWGQTHDYVREIGIGECAGVAYDVVGTIIQDAEDKLENAKIAFKNAAFGDSSYHAYSGFVIGAKALLLSIDVKCNTQISILNDFQIHFVDTEIFQFETDFVNHVLRFKKTTPTEVFAEHYLHEATRFFQQVLTFRENQLVESQEEKLVVDQYYKA
ncbi:MAG: nitrite reductase [Saprospiraceae bacterium]